MIKLVFKQGGCIITTFKGSPEVKKSDLYGQSENFPFSKFVFGYTHFYSICFLGGWVYKKKRKFNIIKLLLGQPIFSSQTSLVSALKILSVSVLLKPYTRENIKMS